MNKFLSGEANLRDVEPNDEVRQEMTDEMTNANGTVESSITQIM